MSGSAFETFRATLVSHGARIANNSQGHFTATCPHHEDAQPSLSVDSKGDRVMVHCHAGCATEDVVADLGLTLADLFDGEPSRDKAVPVRSYLYETALGAPWFFKDRYFPKTFICRLPGTEPGDRKGLKGRAPVLYHLPALIAGMAAGKTIWLVDGEKDVETCERQGIVATTTPHGSGSRWLPEYSQCLSAAVEVVIVVDQDKVKSDGSLGAGQQHAVDARLGLRSVGVKVRIVGPAIGKDATDHFTAGYTEEDFVTDTVAYLRPRGMLADALMDAQFPVLTFCVVDVLPSGLAILAGSPKAGKSWIGLDIALGVAAGGKALSNLVTNQGSVLYLAREDGYRRCQSRIRLLTKGDEPPILSALEIIPAEKPWVGGEQGLAAMSEWAEEVGNPSLVVLDTLAKIEPQLDDRDRYRTDYSMMASYKAWADLHNCTVLFIHHDRKAESPDGDPFTRISGTRGITGAADTLMFLETKRGSREGKLHVAGRDVADQALALIKVGPLWSCIDIPERVYHG